MKKATHSRVQLNASKVHAGVEVVFTVREGSLVPNVLEVRTTWSRLKRRLNSVGVI